MPAFYPVQCSAGGGGGPRQAVAATRLEQIPGQLSRALSGGGVRGDHPSPPTSSQLSPSLLRCCHTTTREVTDCAADISGSSGHCDQYQHNKEVNSELRAAQFLCRDRPFVYFIQCVQWKRWQKMGTQLQWVTRSCVVVCFDTMQDALTYLSAALSSLKISYITETEIVRNSAFWDHYFLAMLHDFIASLSSYNGAVCVYYVVVERWNWQNR